MAERDARVNGITLHVTEEGSGPPVVLCHGFPDLSRTWRHQRKALAGAGYRAISPDMRGYGRSDAPADPDAYDVVTVGADLVGLLDEAGLERAVFVGHDWGAAVVWQLARLHPARVAAVAGLSVPFAPHAPAPPTELLRRGLGDDFYMVWFQRPGEADEALARDVRRTLTTREIWGPGWAERADEDPAREAPAWRGEDELRAYVAEFERTGFTGGLNYYRNIDRSWQLTADIKDRRIEQPALFITGSRDPVRTFMPDAAMRDWAPNLEVAVIEGAGHWVQEERPVEVNELLTGFLGRVGY